MKWMVVNGDALHVLQGMPDHCVDSMVTDPPAGISFMGKCLHPDTDILTARGWVNVSKVSKRDNVCSLSPETGEIEYVGVNKIHRYAYDGDLLKIGGRSVLQIVTPNHRVWCRGQGPVWSLRDAEKLPRVFRLSNQGKWAGVPAHKIPINGKMFSASALMMWFGLWLGDGFVCHRKNQPEKQDFIGFSILKARKVDAIRGACQELGVSFTETPGSDGKVSFYVYDKALLEWLSPMGGAHTKSIPNEFFALSRDLLDRLYMGLVETDGTRQGPMGQEVFYTVSPRLADDFQRLCVHTGRSAVKTLRIKDTTFADDFACYVLSVVQAKPKGFRLDRELGNVIPFSYKGNVHCVTLERNHIMLSRFNGRAVWTGNSWDRPDGVSSKKSKRRGMKDETRKAQKAREKRNEPFARSGVPATPMSGDRQAFVNGMVPILRECLRVLKPGAHILVWTLPRTSHWTATAIEDAGFVVRDSISHIFGQGFPKSLDVLKAIGKAKGVKPIGEKAPSLGMANNPQWNDLKRQLVMPPLEDWPDEIREIAEMWEGWGTSLKPAREDWLLARAPLDEKTVARNVLKHGTGGINIGVSRIGSGEKLVRPSISRTDNQVLGTGLGAGRQDEPGGRFPSHIILSHSPDCEEIGIRKVKTGTAVRRNGKGGHFFGGINPSKKLKGPADSTYAGKGGLEEIPLFRCVPNCPVKMINIQSKGAVSRFFYVAKPAKAEKEKGLKGHKKQSASELTGRKKDSAGLVMKHKDGSEKANPYAGTSGVEARANTHPTVKAIELMRYLCKMITPPGGIVLDPFFGSGSTGVAAIADGFCVWGIERKKSYAAIAAARLIHAAKQAHRGFGIQFMPPGKASK